jgi:hypothetical protein
MPFARGFRLTGKRQNTAKPPSTVAVARSDPPSHNKAAFLLAISPNKLEIAAAQQRPGSLPLTKSFLDDFAKSAFALLGQRRGEFSFA